MTDYDPAELDLMIDIAVSYYEQGEPLDPHMVTCMTEAGISLQSTLDALKYIH